MRTDTFVEPCLLCLCQQLRAWWCHRIDCSPPQPCSCKYHFILRIPAPTEGFLDPKCHMLGCFPTLSRLFPIKHKGIEMSDRPWMRCGEIALAATQAEVTEHTLSATIILLDWMVLPHISCSVFNIGCINAHCVNRVNELNISQAVCLGHSLPSGNLRKSAFEAQSMDCTCVSFAALHHCRRPHWWCMSHASRERSRSSALEKRLVSPARLQVRVVASALPSPDCSRVDKIKTPSFASAAIQSNSGNFTLSEWCRNMKHFGSLISQKNSVWWYMIASLV